MMTSSVCRYVRPKRSDRPLPSVDQLREFAASKLPKVREVREGKGRGKGKERKRDGREEKEKELKRERNRGEGY